MRRIVIAIVAFGLLSIISGQTSVPQPAPVQVVMLGTGTPLPDLERSGPSIAIVVDNKAYLFDAGTGVVRRAAAARQQKGITGPEPRTLRVAFLTHLHSDHTLGLPDLILTPWTMGRAERTAGRRGGLPTLTVLGEICGTSPRARPEPFMCCVGTQKHLKSRFAENEKPRQKVRDYCKLLDISSGAQICSRQICDPQQDRSRCHYCPE